VGSDVGGDKVMKLLKPYLFALLSIIGTSCNRSTVKIDPAFYYWKTTYYSSPEVRHFLSDLQIHKLYMRFFDVDWNTDMNGAYPVAEIHFASGPDTTLQIIPVVFITNRTMEKISVPEINGLSKKIVTKVNTLAEDQGISFSELQLDCDWTEKTRDRYFLLIKSIRTQLHETGKVISATVRLHQVKYPKITGVPDVDRAMLMFYNMGKLDPQTNLNSIYNECDAATYTKAIKNYPLHLDVVLPCFSWAVHIRENKVIGLLNKITEQDLNLTNFTVFGKKKFKVNTSFFFHGEYLMKEDVLKLEEMSPALLSKATRQLERSMGKENRTVAIFDLDSVNIMRYEKENFQEIYNSFR
jgi:hypothetical protein